MPSEPMMGKLPGMRLTGSEDAGTSNGRATGTGDELSGHRSFLHYGNGGARPYQWLPRPVVRGRVALPQIARQLQCLRTPYCVR